MTTLRGLPMHLRNHLRESGTWTSKNDLCRLIFKTAKGGTYGADLISRKLRNLEEQGVIAVKHIDGHSHYKYIPEYLRRLYVPISLRTEDDNMWMDETEMLRRLNAYQNLYKK